MAHNILVAEEITRAGRNILESAGMRLFDNNVNVDPKKISGIIVRSVFRVDKNTINEFPNLRVVAKLGTGLDNVDQEACRSAEIAVVNAPGANATSTAEFIVMQTFAIWKNAYEIHDRVRSRDYRRAEYNGRELAGAHIGIIGYGSVGSRVVDRLSPSVASISIYNNVPLPTNRVLPKNVTFVDALEESIKKMDIIIFCVTLAGNEEMINAELLALCKSDVIIVNAARGGIAKKEDLINFLAANARARYVCDVIDPEPDYTLPPEEQVYTHPLLTMHNVTFTPHIASLTPECQEHVVRAVAKKIKAVLSAV
jgi:D-3-phosphoglycerate dehydrogenase / 2-oxoglutarate reductase